MPEDDRDRPATRRDVMAILDERQVATRGDLLEFRDELRRHFDVMTESLRSDLRNVFDWAQATTSTIGTRVDRIEDEHESRLSLLEVRMTRVEQSRKS